jgi:diaminohydroxyphosphoribosylaminopyrimidine deaminase/5-amino-6-(5-phosphoribosylamino)uracil reductase
VNGRTDEHRMRLALKLAEKARGRTSPNPMVGAVVYQGDLLVGQAYHKKIGSPHAEVLALSQAGDKARGGTLYVTLEPCTHYGHTPPCTEAVIRSGVRRVVIAMKDPNPKVSGGGAERLKEAGLEVHLGVLEEESRRLNEAFITWATKGRPFVIMKSAATLDGKTATAKGDSKWITNEQSRRFVHRIRSWVDAIVVGAGTVLKDDPELTCRLTKGTRDPLRIIVDSRLRISPKARVFSTNSKAPTWIATLESAPADKALRLESVGARIVRVPGREGKIDIEKLLLFLADQNITSLLLEGGMTLNTSFLKAKLVDKIYFFYAPMIMGGGNSKGIAEDLGIDLVSRCISFTGVRTRRFGDDVMIEAYAA